MRERGIIILALGNSLYGKLAIVLASSIKKNSSIPIQLVYSNSALECIPESRLNMLFDIMTECDKKHYTHNGNIEYQKAKLYLNEYSIFDETIYLDADTIICPGRRVEEWFDDLESKTIITFQNAGYYNPITEEETKEGYLYWGDPKDICEYHGISNKLPKLCSTFIYFENKPLTNRIFGKAREIYEDDNSPVDNWNGGKPDEYCFNVSMALNDSLPHRVPYLPIHFIHLHNANTKEEIIDNFIGMSNCGNNVPKFLSKIYNDFVDYYFNYFGFRDKYYHVNKSEVIETRKYM